MGQTSRSPSFFQVTGRWVFGSNFPVILFFKKWPGNVLWDLGIVGTSSGIPNSRSRSLLVATASQSGNSREPDTRDLWISSCDAILSTAHCISCTENQSVYSESLGIRALPTERGAKVSTYSFGVLTRAPDPHVFVSTSVRLHSRQRMTLAPSAVTYQLPEG